MDDAQKWWVVLNASGVKGKIPSNHVKVTGALDMRMRSATTSSPTSRQLAMAAKLLEQQQSRAGGGGGAVSDGGGDGADGSARGGGGGGSSSGGGGSGSGSGAGPAAPHMAYVLADYNAVREGELSIKKGEAITVVDDRKKWWVVRNQGGEAGKAPSNFFVMADNPYAVQGQVEVQIAAELAQLRSAANEQNRRVADSSMAQAYADAQIRAREEIKRIAAIAFARANKSRIPTPSAAAHAAASSPSPLSTVAASVDSDSGSSGRESLIAPISAAVSTPSAEAAPLRPTAQSASDIAAEDLAERAAETAAAAAEATAAAAAEAAAEEEEEEAVAAAAPSSASGKSKPKRKAPKAQWRIDMEEKAKSEKAARRKQDKLRKELKNTIKDQQAMRRAKAEANKLMIKENTRNMVSQAFNPPPPPENPDDFDFVGMDANILEEEDAMRWNAMGITNPAFLETGRLRRADSGQVARAVRDYIAESPAEISVLQDELVIVLDDREAYWIVRGMDGDGKVPESVFELDGESPERYSFFGFFFKKRTHALTHTHVHFFIGIHCQLEDPDGAWEREVSKCPLKGSSAVQSQRQ